MSGSGGCNRASGSLTVNGAAIQVGPLLSTKTACVDTALNAQEQQFFSAVQGSDRYAIAAHTLALYRGADRVARLAR